MKNQEIKNRIFFYAKEYIKKYGLRTFTTTHLCKNLNISKKTFYKIYNSKEELIGELFLDTLIGSYENVVVILQAKTSFISKIGDISFIVENQFQLFNNNTMTELKKLYPSIYFEVDNFRNKRIKPLLVLLIEKAQKHKIINEFEPKFLITLFFSIITSIFTENLKNTGSKNKQYLFRDVLNLILSGLLTKRGKSILNYNLLKGKEK
jgi:hypothetical protein